MPQSFSALTSRFVRNALGASAFLLIAAQAGAQSWPSKPIRLLVPLAAGSTADIVSRRAGIELSKALGQPLVIENKPGAGGTIATAEMARATPDGYTLGFASQGTLVFNQALYAKPGYDSVKDLSPIAFIGGVSNVMIVIPSGPVREPRAIIEVAKAKPGTVTYSSGGSGTSHHLSGVLFGQMTGTDLVHVPYKATPAGIVAVMSGEVMMGFFNTPTVLNQIRDGKLRALGVTSLTRSPLLPDVPTLNEKGIKGYEVNTWFGLVGPSRLSADIINRLNSEIARALAQPDLRASMTAQGIDIAPPAPPDAFGKFIVDDLAKWIPIITRSGAKVD
jgi:tripartite-type tricarboxylate transporter receptor subunit TctC